MMLSSYELRHHMSSVWMIPPQALGSQCHLTEQSVHQVFDDGSANFFLPQTEVFLQVFLSLAISPFSY